jgi:hypothetical protein
MGTPTYVAASTRWVMGVGLLFALPALAVGRWSFKMLFWDYVWYAVQAREWPQVQATVQDVDWKWMKATPMASGPLGRDMQVVVRYQYRFQSAPYTGTHVGFESFAARDRGMSGYSRTSGSPPTRG